MVLSNYLFFITKKMVCKKSEGMSVSFEGLSAQFEGLLKKNSDPPSSKPIAKGITDHPNGVL